MTTLDVGSLLGLWVKWKLDNFTSVDVSGLFAKCSQIAGQEGLLCVLSYRNNAFFIH